METGRWCFSCDRWIRNQQQFHSDFDFWEAHHHSAAHKNAADKYTGPTEGEWDGLSVTATLSDGRCLEFRDVARFLRKYGYTDKLYLVDNTYFAIYSKMESAVSAISDNAYCQGLRIEVRPKFDWATAPPPVDISKIKLNGEGSWEEQARQLAVVLRLPNSIPPREKQTLDNKIDQLCNDVQSTLLCFFTNVQCFVYGSRVTGLAGVDSDIDLFAQLDMRNTEFEDLEMTHDLTKEVLKKCDRQLRYKPRLFSNILTVYHARIPVTHFLHLPTMIECDITCKNMLSVYNSRFLGFISSLDQRIFSLFLILKQWKKAHVLPMSTYSLTMLAIFYLQSLPHPFLPPIANLQKNAPVVLENNWSCSFSKEPIEIKNDISLRDLLVRFFKFLSALDFGVDIICPLLGTTFERWEFKQPDKLPADLQGTFNVMPEVQLPIEKPMVIQDPFELNHNITKGMTHKNMVDLVSLASKVADLCDKNPQLPLIDMIRFDPPKQKAQQQQQNQMVEEKFWLKDFNPSPDQLQNQSVRELWFQEFSNLLRDIFTEIFLFEIKDTSTLEEEVHSDSDAPPSKIQRMPTTSDSFSWNMVSPVALMNGRKKHQPNLKSGGRFIKEILTTQIYLQKFFSDLSKVDKRFYLCLRVQLVLHQRPTFAQLTINNDGCDKQAFMSVCRYVTSDLHNVVDQSLGSPYKTELEKLKEHATLSAQLEAFGIVSNYSQVAAAVMTSQVQSNPHSKKKKPPPANPQNTPNSGRDSNPFLRAIEKHC